jgi:AraC-like DNA-binding protein
LWRAGPSGQGYSAPQGCARIGGVYEVGRFVSSSPVPAPLGWQDEVSRLHGAFRIGTPTQGCYRGRLAWQGTSSYRLVRWAGAAERLVRSGAEVSRDPRDTYELVVPVSGEVTLEQGGRRAVIGPGDMLFVNMARPALCEHAQPCAAVCLIAPLDRVRSRIPRSAETLVADRRSGLGYVVWSMLESLREQESSLSGQVFEAICDRLVDLAVLASAAPDADAPDHHAEVESAIRSYVRLHVRDPWLDGAAIAAALGWSLRLVQLVLQRSGTTPTDVIRFERLSLARSLLEDPRQRHRTIAAIAAECGFGSAAAFTKAFRAGFGVSPRAVRAEVR